MFGAKRIQDQLHQLREEMRAGQGGETVHEHPMSLEPGLDHVANNRHTRAFLLLRPSKEDKDGVQKTHQLLQALTVSCPVSFEVFGSRSKIWFQITCEQSDQASLIGLVSSLYPNAEVFLADDALGFCGPDVRVSAFRLQESHVFPLNTRFNADPLGALFGVLSVLSTQDFGGVQVVFRPVQSDWHSRILGCSRSSWDPMRSPFIDLPDLPKLAEEKCSSRLFAVSLRLFASTERILDSLEGFLNQFTGRNRFVRLRASYPGSSVLSRSVHSRGCILNAVELSGLVHLPGSDTFVPQLEAARKTAPPPDLARSPNGILFGANTHRGSTVSVSVDKDFLTKHLLILGATGSGKTVWQAAFFRQFIRHHGAIYLDPSGDSARSFLKLIPPERVNSTIFIDPCDFEYAPSFNILEMTAFADSDLIRSSLLTALRRLYGTEGMGPRSEWLASHALATLLQSSHSPKTLVDLPRLLTDSVFRRVVLAPCQDPALLQFWGKEYPKLPESAVLPLLNKLHAFLGHEKIRSMLCQRAKVDLGKVIRDKQILVISLAKGELGESPASTLGFLMLATIQQAILGLSKVPPQERDYFGVIIDEAHLFLDRENVETITSLLSESRKFKAVTVLATQFLAQADRKVRDALLGNVGTLLCFRVGVDDAQVLQKELGRFTADDLLNLTPGEAIARMGRAQDSFNLKTDLVDLEALPEGSRQQIIQHSRERYYTRRDLLRPASTAVRQQDQEQHNQQKQTAPERPGVSPEEQAFLQYVYDQPTLSVTQLYKAQNLSAYRGDRIKRALVERGILSEITTHLGKGSRIAKFLVLTPKAFQVLGVDFNPGDGKGGVLHRYFQSVIRFHAEGKGYTAVIEEPILGGRESVDVGLQREGERIAVEISITTNAEQELNNVTKCLRGGFGRVIVLMLDERKIGELKARVQDAIPDADHPKVIVGLVHEFCRFL